MVDITKLKPGMKVHYWPVYYRLINKVENGVVKEILQDNKNEVRVVFNCNNDWDNYEDYTSALTPIEDLFFGWK